MKKQMQKIYCDFCEKEIEESTPVVSGEVATADTEKATFINVEIRLSSTEPRKRFPHDICLPCVFGMVGKLQSGEHIDAG